MVTAVAAVGPPQHHSLVPFVVKGTPEALPKIDPCIVSLLLLSTSLFSLLQPLTPSARPSVSILFFSSVAAVSSTFILLC